MSAELDHLPQTDALGQKAEFMMSLLSAHTRTFTSDTPTLDALSRLLIPPNSEYMVHSESVITAEELVSLYDLVRRETQYRDAYREYRVADARAFVRGEYLKIKEGLTQENLETRSLDSLALTLFAMRYAYGEGKEPFEPRMTQRLALLRGVKEVIKPDSKGYVESMPTGQGKSSVLIPGLLPTLLLIKPHWDVITQRPITRHSSMQRFFKLSQYFGISTSELLPNGRGIFGNGRGPIGRNAQRAILDAQVMFLMREDLGHLLEREFQKMGDILALDPKSRGVMIDEIDESLIDERTVPMVISGTETPLFEHITNQWKPMKDALERVSIGRKKGRQKHRMRQRLYQMLHPYRQEIQHMLPEGIAPDDHTNDALSILRFVFTQIPVMQKVVRFARTADEYFHADGSITRAGRFDLRRRMYHAVLGKPYDSQDTVIPPEWDTALDNVIPEHVYSAIDVILRGVHSGIAYYSTPEGVQKLMSTTTGFPQHNREYEALVTVCMYMQESMRDTRVKLPRSLHKTIDSMTPDELMHLAYSHTVGFTGTGADSEVVEWFEKLYGLHVIAIPPETQSRLSLDHPYIPVYDMKDKAEAMIAFIHSLSQDTHITPVLIDVPSIATGEAVYHKLIQHFGDISPHVSIRLLDARNATEAEQILKNAGQMDMITIVVLMAGREVDIPVAEQAKQRGGLTVLAWEPRTMKREERQLAGRAGRGEDPGTYVCLVSPDDSVFRYVSHLKHRITHAIRRGDIKKVERLIRTGQKVYADRLLHTNEQQIKRIRPFVTIRTHIQNIKDDYVRVKIASLWQYFLTIMDIRFVEHREQRFAQALWSDPDAKVYEAYVLRSYIDLYKHACDPNETSESLFEWFRGQFNEFPEASI